MGKITRTIQAKHRLALTPWLTEFVNQATATPLPKLPKKLTTFPSGWPFPRGDLYHWIPLLNRFDNILAAFTQTYKLDKGPQLEDFSTHLLQNQVPNLEFADDATWDIEHLSAEGYSNEGDRELVEAVLKFTSLLLERCGNRSIYASSAHLNEILNTTSLTLLVETLLVGSKLAHRYQASVKRLGGSNNTRQINALLANHYNIELDRVQCLTQAFVKTSLLSSDVTTPNKGKDRANSHVSRLSSPKYATDFLAILSPDNNRWDGWGDIRVTYYPQKPSQNSTNVEPANTERQSSSTNPHTPTSLRRSSTMGSSSATRSTRMTDDASPTKSRGVSFAPETPENNTNWQKVYEVRQVDVVSKSMTGILSSLPSDLPASSRYEVLHRLRIAKALLGNLETRRQILSIRLLAILNLAFIHQEQTFVDKCLRYDVDETRKYQLVYQLAELIHQTSGSSIQVEVPLSIQTIAFNLLENISSFESRSNDVFAALNANVNHGILLYIVRKAVVGIKEDKSVMPKPLEYIDTELDEWRRALLTLALTMSMSNRINQEMAAAGLVEALVDMLTCTTSAAKRLHGTIMQFLDNLVLNYSPAFNTFFNINGLDVVSQVVVDAVRDSLLEIPIRGIPPELRSETVDYRIAYWHHLTLKWALKYLHHIMCNWYQSNGNADRLLRNLADKSDLLQSLRTILENIDSFGSGIWTSSVSILTDFINNDPTSFAAISESGMIRSFLQCVSGHEISAGATGTEESAQLSDSHQAESSPEKFSQPSASGQDSTFSDRPVAKGILPAADAIRAIPAAISSISLNHQGLDLVIKSRIFETLLEVFESKPHLECMTQDRNLAVDLGRQFDELARHHPALKDSISKAVIRMVTRVGKMGRAPKTMEEWGTHMFIINSNGIVVHCNEQLPEKLRQADLNPLEKLSDKPDGYIDPEPKKETFDFTTCLQELSSFLELYEHNVTLKREFIRAGGLNMLLDLLDCYSVSSTVLHPDSPLNALFASIARLTEEQSCVYFPSLLMRAIDSFKSLEPLLKGRSDGRSFFAPIFQLNRKLRFEEFNTLSEEDQYALTHGEDIVRSLLRTQMLVLTICCCFPMAPNSQSSSILPPGIAFDLHQRLITECGKLTDVCFREATKLNACVPQNWQPIFWHLSDTTQALSADSAGDDVFMSSILQNTIEHHIIDAWGNSEIHCTGVPEDQQRQIQTMCRYKSYSTAKFLLDIAPTAIPSLYAAYGKALFIRRHSTRHTYIRGQHVELAKTLGALLEWLKRGVKEPPSSLEDYVYVCKNLLLVEDSIQDSYPDGSSPNKAIPPNFLAFQSQGLFPLLNRLINCFALGLTQTDANSQLFKLCRFGLRKILSIYNDLLHPKALDQFNHTTIGSKVPKIDNSSITQVLNTEIRVEIVQTILKLWNSPAVEFLSRFMISQLINILRQSSTMDSDNALTLHLRQTIASYAFSSESQQFVCDNTNPLIDGVRQRHPNLTQTEEELQSLATEAMFRSNNLEGPAGAYMDAVLNGVVLHRAPPPPDAIAAFPAENPAEPPGTESEHEAFSEHDSDSTDDESTDVSMHGTSGFGSSDQQRNAVIENRKIIIAFREQLLDKLVDRSLEILGFHSEVAVELSDLILTLIGSERVEQRGEEFKETGTTVIYALVSLFEEVRTKNNVVQAYAHLLALLLQDKNFFNQNFKVMQENLDQFIGVLSQISSSSTEALPGWVPYVLMFLEILLGYDEQPLDSKWAPPGQKDPMPGNVVLMNSPAMFTNEQRETLLQHTLNLLRRIGKNEQHAIASLRVLLVLTRHRELAVIVGEKSNLQLLFMLFKQISSLGADRLRSQKLDRIIMIILRHIIEDEQTIKQIMRHGIKNYFDTNFRSSRTIDVPSYLRAMPAVALRSHKLFVEVTNEMLKFVRWTSSSLESGKGNYLGLREQPDQIKHQSSEPEVPADSSGTSTSQTVQPSTEAVDDVDMTDAPKTSDNKKIPILEHPDGVIHFLLSELVKFREVNDQESLASNNDTDAETHHANPTATPSGRPEDSSVPSTSTTSEDDKKASVAKPGFKPEEHPIFVYRCFLINALTELVQSYNRCKMEFINFKRSAPMQHNTPIRPRSSVLNYLISGLLCQGTLNGSSESIVAKKRSATSHHVQRLLVSLIQRTPEQFAPNLKNKYEYDDDADLLFVRTFVLDTVLKAYERATVPEEPLEVRYARMQSLSELMSHMVGEKDREVPPLRTEIQNSHTNFQIRRMMFEKGYIEKLTASIADVDLNYPGFRRSIKHILRVLRVLTDTAKELSLNNLISTGELPDYEDDIESAASLSDMDEGREETPDLYRNSTLGDAEIRDDDDDYSENGEDNDDEAMYEDEYGDEMEYDEEDSGEDEGVSDDEDEELEAMEGMEHMGPIENHPGLPVGPHGGLIEVVMDDDQMDEDMDEDDDDDDDNGEDDEDEDDIVLDEDGNPVDDEIGSAWNSEDAEDEDDAVLNQLEHEYHTQLDDPSEPHHHHHGHPEVDILDNLARVVMGEEGEEFDSNVELDDYDMQEEDEDLDDDDDDYAFEEEEFIPYDLRSRDMRDHDLLDHISMENPIPPPPRHRVGRTSSSRFFSHSRDLHNYRGLLGSTHRSHGHHAPGPMDSDGANPLLRPSVALRTSMPRPVPGQPGAFSFSIPQGMLRHDRHSHSFNSSSHPMNVLRDLIASMPDMHRGQPVHLQIGPGAMGEWSPGRDHRITSFGDWRRETSTSTNVEPYHAVAFLTQTTQVRYDQEASIVFTTSVQDRAFRLACLITAALTPEAQEVEQAHRAKQEQEAQEAARAAERARQARLVEEQRRREEDEEAAAAAAARVAEDAAAARVAEESAATRENMEGIETQGTDETAGEPRDRVVTTIDGEDIDVTSLGIDPEYLAALPEEFRAEVIAQAVSTRRSEARQNSQGDQTEEFQEFLDVLPNELRDEIIHHERQEQRRRHRDEARRQSQAQASSSTALPDANAGASGSGHTDGVSISRGFPPGIEDVPPELSLFTHRTAEFGGSSATIHVPSLARDFLLPSSFSFGSGPFPPVLQTNFFSGSRPGTSFWEAAGLSNPKNATATEAQGSTRRPAVVQMLDKAGVATLLRLMFISQQGSIRSSLFNVLDDVCQNRQNRIEIISTLLQILQDGSTDMDAVERSFGQLSLKAKRPRESPGPSDLLKTPQSTSKRSYTFTSSPSSTVASSSRALVSTHSEISPLLIVQQCLDLLSHLAKSPHITHLFLTEHDLTGNSLKKIGGTTTPASARSRSKTRLSKESKSQRFAINSLLTLLDRDLVMESSVVMTLLAELIYRLTIPLQNMDRRRREYEESQAKATEEKTKTKETSGSQENNAGEGSSESAAKKPNENTAHPRPIQMPVIPNQNLTRVVKIFVARECSSKTFQNTISAIKNLSSIPGAKAVFGQELVCQAHLLAQNIGSDLDALLPCIRRATSGTEIQGIALAKFSPGTSDQNKLLRVLTALDHLFDSHKKAGGDNAASHYGDSSDTTDKRDLILSLFQDPGFSSMWDKLSGCLRIIRERDNMINIATILLPLIETLMVVCKSTASVDDISALAPVQKDSGIEASDIVVSSPLPTSTMSTGPPVPSPGCTSPSPVNITRQKVSALFFNFTGEHRRILNELVRNNPKLMSANFSLLVRNPTVLEFDNKRNYFTRSVHSRNNAQINRQTYPTLQISVRRDMVFHDSYRSLYFKTGDEMKYGKLNIRFQGEEGVDAGGVTREWFQVLSRQMFDANYALFIPVSSDRTTFHLNKLSAVNDQHLLYFKFVGRIIGKALYEGRVLDCHFSRAVYKRILGKSVSVKDMESFDPDYYKSLVWMLNNDITDIITDTFSIEDEEFGVVKVVDLIENGRNIEVTEENKRDYVRLVVEHKLLSSVKDQMEHFLKGFHDVIPAELISIFNEQELELLISGLPDVDVDDWKAHTEYHNYTAASPQIQWFWRAVRSFDKEEKAKLLQFVTGTSKVPLNGFKELEGMNGVSRFNIHRDYGNKDRLPSSHTCFNQLDIPEYENYETLRAQLLKAITAGNDYFGFA